MIRPTYLQRSRAYLATGSLPPPPTFRAPRLGVSTLAAGYVAAVALGGFGLGLMIAGAAL